MRHASFCKIPRILVLLTCCAVPASSVVADDSGTGRVTVSGISAGGYAAVQAHVALSSTISGAAAVAGGPYHCAEGNIVLALGRCISGAALEAAPLVEATRSAASAGAIDPVESLSTDRVWLFHGEPTMPRPELGPAVPARQPMPRNRPWSWLRREHA